MDFFDVHAHQIENQCGGFIIALENENIYTDIFNNESIKEIENRSKLLFAVEYVTSKFQETEKSIVKYHPQREGYSLPLVEKDIVKRAPKICIIDTLNQPFWQPQDYWILARKFKHVQFLFAHSGGWDIMDFIRIAILEDNVWLDFSWTQEYFGWCGNGPKYQNIINTIEFAFSHKKLIKKIMFGSDNPFYSQNTAIEKYSKLSHYERFSKNNFLSLITNANI